MINDFFNEYNELSHKPTEGKCDTILHIINHVFGKKYYDFAIDYLQIMYREPYQRLPILLLESDKKNTGKSTFGTLIYKIFQDNAIKIGNNDIQSDFNAILKFSSHSLKAQKVLYKSSVLDKHKLKPLPRC